MKERKFVKVFGDYRIYREGLGHYMAYNRFTKDFEVSGDTLKEVELELLKNEETAV